MAFDIEVIRDAASTRWTEIISHLAGIDPSTLDGKHHPCPKCGGNDRFRFFADSTGGAICNQCLQTKNGDGFAVLQWLLNKDFSDSLAAVADHLGIKPTKNGRKRKEADPEEHLEFHEWNEMLVALWCQRKPPITPEAVRLVGGRLATYRSQWQVIALPVRPAGEPEANAIGWVLYPLNGKTLPVYQQDGSTTWVKIKTMPGTQPGLIGHMVGSNSVIKTEGPSDALSLLSQGSGPNEDVVCNVHGAKEDPRKLPGLAEYISGKVVVVVHDADQAGEDGAGEVNGRPGWATFAATFAASCRWARLPYEVTPDHGKDLRDYFSEGNTREDFDKLVAGSPILRKGDTPAFTAIESDDDPHRLARVNIERYASRYDGATLCNWRDEWYAWKTNRYRKIPTGELAAKLNLSIKHEFDRLNIEEQESSTKKIQPTKKVTKALVGNVLEATKGMTVLSSYLELGTWVDAKAGIRERRQYIALENGILDMDALFADLDDVLIQHTPRWFSTTCLPYKFDPDAKCPKWMAFLEHNLEGDKERIDLLQEWAGYMLLPDTGQQRFLVLEGEGANGKSVYMAALEAMLGEENCSHVPLELFGDRFSRTQTLGKLANIAPDVGELDKPAEGHLKSFTGGEKMFFDRKNLIGLEAYPTARLMIGCNNKPRFSDKSDGVYRRMLLVPLRIQIAEDKRIKNMDKPWWWQKSGELPGMLLWAIAGLDRLQRNGCFTIPAICREALEDYRLDNNPAMQFLHDNTSFDVDYETPCAELYDRYKRWCTDNGYHSLSNRSFGREVSRLCNHQTGSKNSFKRQQRRVMGTHAWFYVGLRSQFEEKRNSQQSF